MAREEIAGYIIFGIYGLAFLGGIRVFGIRWVALVALDRRWIRWPLPPG